MVQTTFGGGTVERYYCIHCNYHGYEFDMSGEHEVCPKCGWVVYSDSEVKRSWIWSNCYPKLVEKYNRVHKTNHPIR